MKINKVYIASPLFNPKERQENQEIDDILKKSGYETFLPQRDGFIYSELFNDLKKEGCTEKQAEKIALKFITYLDIYQVCKGCDATVLNLNGRVPDEGAVSEATMCFRSEKPLVIYKQDARSLAFGKDNPLITGLADFEIVNQIKDIPKQLKKLESITESSYKKIISTASYLFEKYPMIKSGNALAFLGKEYLL